MIKIVTLLKRKPGMSRDAFIAHYEQVHAPLAVTLIPGLVGYRRSYIDPSRPAFGQNSESPGFDAITELLFADEAAYEGALAAFARPEVAAAIAADEENLFDRTCIKAYVVEEHRSTFKGEYR